MLKQTTEDHATQLAAHPQQVNKPTAGHPPGDLRLHPQRFLSAYCPSSCKSTCRNFETTIVSTSPFPDRLGQCKIPLQNPFALASEEWAEGLAPFLINQLP